MPPKRKIKKTPAKKTKKKAKKTAGRKTSRKKKGELCAHSEKETCNKCLMIARELLLSEELDEKELKRVRRIMTNIITKKGVLKEEVKFLGNLSEAYLN